MAVVSATSLAFATDPHDIPVFNPKIPIDI